jgi:hypothetical protein
MEIVEEEYYWTYSRYFLQELAKFTLSALLGGGADFIQEPGRFFMLT